MTDYLNLLAEASKHLQTLDIKTEPQTTTTENGNDIDPVNALLFLSHANGIDDFNLNEPNFFFHKRSRALSEPILSYSDLIEPVSLDFFPEKYKEIYNKDGRIGIYTPEERMKIIERFRMKRTRRNYNKKVRYACRKNLADSRIRIKGRFVKGPVIHFPVNDTLSSSSSPSLPPITKTKKVSAGKIAGVMRRHRPIEEEEEEEHEENDEENEEEEDEDMMETEDSFDVNHIMQLSAKELRAKKNNGRSYTIG